MFQNHVRQHLNNVMNDFLNIYSAENCFILPVISCDYERSGNTVRMRLTFVHAGIKENRLTYLVLSDMDVDSERACHKAI